MRIADVFGRASIRTKLSAGMVVMSLAIVTAATVLLTSRHNSHVEADLERKCALYAQLLSSQLEPAVAFKDRETAREVLRSLTVDQDVQSLALYDQEGHLIEGLGPVGPAAPPNVAALTVTPGTSEIVAVTPVVSREGPRGLLVVSVGTYRIDADRRSSILISVLVGACAMMVALLFAFAIGRYVSRRLALIAAAATRVADGDLEQDPVEPGAPDEIGQLTTAFNVMIENLKSLTMIFAATAQREQETLTRKVKERTLELDARNADMRMVLENVGQGFLTVDREGRMSAERSAILDWWFGAAAGGETFADYLGRADRSFASWFAIGLESLVEDLLPAELLLDQMPRRLTSEGTTWDVTYRRIPAEGAMEKVLVVISDVTAEIARESAELERSELAGVLEKAMRDADGVVEFVKECDDITRRIQDPLRQRADVLRDIHTLKGNSAIFGLSRVPVVCHEVETAVLGGDGDIAAAERTRVLDAWAAFRARVEPFMKARAAPLITLSQEEHAQFLEAIARGRQRDQLLRSAADWAREPADVRFARISDHVTATARRVGKPVPVVEVQGGGVRLPRDRWSPFWAAFVHAVSNALDHGIELPEARMEAGKPERGHVTMAARLDGDSIEITLSDDGRGIDWQRVRERAAARGLPCETREELVEVLFADGLSTREEATEVSGRGVGMGALRSSCVALGGEITIESRAGHGTTVRARLPRDDDAVALSRVVGLPVSIRRAPRHAAC